MTDSVAGMDPRLRMEAAGYSVPGFAERYDAVRFRPPEALLTLLPPILGGGRPGTVVDLGSGTGLSTRFWAESAGEVIGVEPNAAMRTCAERLNRASTVRFVDGSGEQTGLPGATADLVTASQSLHWMAPEPTFAEIGRILRPGGVLCAYEYRSFQTPLWEPEDAWARVRANVASLRTALRLDERLRQWPIETGALRASGVFRLVRETAMHSHEEGDGSRLLELALSEGSLQTLLAAGVTEAEVGLDELRRVTRSMPRVPWWIGYRVWLALRDGHAEAADAGQPGETDSQQPTT